MTMTNRSHILMNLVCLAAGLFLIVAGCDSPAGPLVGDGKTAAGRPTDGLTAVQILDRVNRTYAAANTYQDRGVLNLSYRMDGLLTEEPQPWSVAWSRDGKLSLQLFNSQIRADGRRLDCFIYDIDTANLDNQRLVLPYAAGELTVAKLFRDPIAQHFLSGYSEMPFSEQKSFQNFVPSTVSLLTKQTSCNWVQNPTQAERLPDQPLGDKDCYVVRSLADGMTCDIWVDKATGLLAQMSLPLQLLDPKVMKSSSITDIQLLAKFVNAAIDQPLDLQMFEMKERPDASAVTEFVPLPEALPVESIGQTLSDLKLVRPDGKEIGHLYFDGKPTALLWLGGENSYSAIDRLIELAEELSLKRFNFGIIYSDSELAGTPAQPHLISSELTAATAGCELPLFYDPNLNASTAIAIRTIPSVVVLDGESRVQFAASVVGKSWEGDLRAALRRVAAGEEVGDEMLDQYHNFVRKYHERLADVNAEAYLPSRLRSSVVTKQPAGERNLPARDSLKPAFAPRLLWTSRDFQKPGNITTLPAVSGVRTSDSAAVAVLDGFRTVVSLDQTGNAIDRKEIELPDGVGLTTLRLAKVGSGTVDLVQAAFSVLGKQVYLFDKDWKSLGNLLPAAVTHKGIRDVQFRNDAGDKDLVAVVSFDDRLPLAFRMAETLAAGAGQEQMEFALVASVVRGALIRPNGSDAKPTIVKDPDLKFHRMFQQGISGQRNSAATAVDKTGQWYLIGLAEDLSIGWRTEIGSQLFESNVDPVSLLEDSQTLGSPRKSGMPAWAVACQAGGVHVLDWSGNWLADIPLAKPATGLAIMTLNQRTCIVVSVEDRVECWALE